jgi:hypothetical protein
MHNQFDPAAQKAGQRPPVMPAPSAVPSWLSWQVVVAFLTFPVLGILLLGVIFLSGVFSPPPAPPVANRPPTPAPTPAPSPAPAPKKRLPPEPSPFTPIPAPSPRTNSPVESGKTPRYYNPATGHDYQLIDTAMSWHDAKTACEKLGGHLATATSDAENEFIFRCFGQDHVCWLGATDEKQEGDWKWVTGEPWQYTNWMTGEPSNYGNAEHYLTLGNMPPLTLNGQTFFYRFGPKWNDHGVQGDYHGVKIAYPVCEFEQHDPAAKEPK